jgi:uncharacterized membrane protein YheB (UPF0754 family)
MNITLILHYVSGPLIGALIGYITNYIAIRMLFRPLEPKYIGRFRLPFTPGIVPRRKDELAVILGKAVVDHFFNADDLEEIFTSDYLSKAFAEGIADTLISEKSVNDITAILRDDGNASEISNSQAQDLTARLKEALCVRILAGALKADAAKIISEEVSDIISQRTQGALLKSLGDSLINSISGPLSEKIDGYILHDGREVVMSLLDEEFAILAEEPIKNLTENLVGDRETLVDLIAHVYTKFMNARVRSIVSTIDVESQIREKIFEMDPIEVETLVVSVVKKELKYVVWLGALLGLVIGAVGTILP